MNVFEKNIHELDLDDIRALVENADSETLYWEAKGAGAPTKELARTACAFANGHATGYLLYGVKDKTWEFEGVELPDEAATWISNVLKTRLSPLPTFDAQAIPLEGSRVILVIEIDPLPDPPCISSGSVYERLPGQTRVVDDANRLADLYRRGETAHKMARSVADQMTEKLAGDRTTGQQLAVTDPRFEMGVAAIGRVQDMNRILFSRQFRSDLQEAITEHLLDGSGQDPYFSVTQSTLTGVGTNVGNLRYIQEWQVEVNWVGAVGIRYWTQIKPARVDQLIENRASQAWSFAQDVLKKLGSYGDTYMGFHFDGGRGAEIRKVLARRGPIPMPPTADLLPSIGREIHRAGGEFAYEGDSEEAESEGGDKATQDQSAEKAENTES